jgi:hypothetical protein
VDSPSQLSKRTKPDGIFPFLEVSDRALGKCSLARETFRGKLFCGCPDFLQILRVDYSSYSRQVSSVGSRTPASALMVETLEQVGWIVGGPRGAAAKLGLKRTTLLAKMRRLGISRPIHQEGTAGSGVARERMLRFESVTAVPLWSRMGSGCGRPLAMDEEQPSISPCRPRRRRHHLWLLKRFPFLTVHSSFDASSTHCNLDWMNSWQQDKEDPDRVAIDSLQKPPPMQPI